MTDKEIIKALNEADGLKGVITMQNDMRDRLVELLDKAFVESDDNYGMPCTDQVADHLIENGVVILFCKVGDRVYQTDGVRIYELEVLDVSIHKNMPYYKTESIDFDTKAIGTSIFLTKAEAEQKLNEMRENNEQRC